MYIREKDFRNVAELWGELSEPSAATPDELRQHTLTRLAHLLHASNGFWLGSLRATTLPVNNDVLSGWRPRAFHSLYDTALRQELGAEHHRRTLSNIIDPHTAAVIAGAGTTRALLRGELISDSDWKKSWLYNEILRPQAIEDRLIGVRPVTWYTESAIALEREPDQKPFGERERDILKLFLSGCARFHRDQLVANDLLTAANRQAFILHR